MMGLQSMLPLSTYLWVQNNQKPSLYAAITLTRRVRKSKHILMYQLCK